MLSLVGDANISPNTPFETHDARPVLLTSRTKVAPVHACWKQKVKRFVLRIDVLWTAIFFVFLVVLSVIILSVTHSQLLSSSVKLWHAVHNAHVERIKTLINQRIEKAHRIATAIMAANVENPLPMRSEKTLSIVCSTFVNYDTDARIRAVLMVSASQKETVACIQGVYKLGSTSWITGYMSNNSIVKGTYLVNSTSYEFAHPLVMATAWDKGVQNISNSMSASLLSRNGFVQSRLYYRGLIDHVNPRTLWFYFTKTPHFFYYNIPMSYVARGFTFTDNASLDDFAQVRIDGSQLLPLSKAGPSSSQRMVLLVNLSLTTSDPLIFSTNFGQQAVSNTTIYSANAASNVSYLKVSEVSDPLMRAAMRHVDLRALQTEGYAYTTDFYYRGSLATVTALAYVAKRGLVLPIVTVSAQTLVAPPYLLMVPVSCGISAAAVLVLTALFWWFVHTAFSRPLQRMTELMLDSLATGHRTLFHPPDARVGAQLSEVRALVDAHDATVRRLRDIDKFIPPELRNRAGGYAAASTGTASQTTSPDTARESQALLQQQLTVVSVNVQAAPASAADAADTALLAAPPESARQGQRLAAAVDTAAHAARLVSSGPFPSPAALERFLCKVEDLCDAHRGVVHRLAPDTCVLHFGGAARAHMQHTAATSAAGSEAGSDAALDACVAEDAQDAVAFAMQLQDWVARARMDGRPAVTVLVDTSLFTCGRYRPRGSEQTMSVAFGRNVNRKLGYVPAKIGVRVALTEETARLVRAGCGRRRAFAGVRQIPVESLHIGRPGLNADVVILYEALPGPVDGDAAWELYSACCFRGFTAMVRGDYAGALRAYKAVADISDLEPGLMPRSLRREAAPTRVGVGEGGAASVQVDRLIRECEKRVEAGDVRRFCRERCDPLGIDALLQGVWTLSAAPAATAQPPHSRLRADADAVLVAPYPRADQRHVVDLRLPVGSLRTVIATPPEWMRDNLGLYWKVAQHQTTFTARAMWESRFLGLGSAGALATLSFLAFRDVPRGIAAALQRAPPGLMADATRSAVPVMAATVHQREALRTLRKRHCELRHPNLLTPLSYTLVVEGGAALIWECFACGSLRQVVARYARIKPVTQARFAYGVLSGLAHLHRHRLPHGALHMDNVIVGADGVCRLCGFSTPLRLYRRLFVLPRYCYVSPLMAAGALPTPACDVFCYGLMCIEVLTGAKAWAWAPLKESEGQPQRADEEELAALTEEAGQAFYDAVVAGRVVANAAALDGASVVAAYGEEGLRCVRACLSADPAARPTALEMLRVTRDVLLAAGLAVNDIAE